MLVKVCFEALIHEPLLPPGWLGCVTTILLAVPPPPTPPASPPAPAVPPLRMPHGKAHVDRAWRSLCDKHLTAVSCPRRPITWGKAARTAIARMAIVAAPVG